MAYRGYLAINGVEIANSARVISHMGGETPTLDSGFFPSISDGSYSIDPEATGVTVHGTYDWVFQPGVGFVPPADATLVEHSELPGWYLLDWTPWTPIQSTDYPGMWMAHESQVEVSEGLWTPMTGSRVFGPGLFVHDQAWGSPTHCSQCRTSVIYDDSWQNQREWLGDSDYRVELAPWYSAEIPESAEFGGVWVMDLKGFDSTPSERQVTQAAGHGGVAGPYRDASRSLSFEALLIACSNAGVEHGLKWLTNVLRSTNRTTDRRLRYLTASPEGSGADPDTLLRELHALVLTKAPEVLERFNTGTTPHQHGNVYRISWEMASLSPYAYLPQFSTQVEWDRITRQPINWIHSGDCKRPETCEDMPVMFSRECQPETIARVESPPPVCGGCLPVSAIDKYSWRLPTMDYAFRGRETAVTLAVRNISGRDLTLQAFMRECGSDIRCEDNLFPLQITGLPPGGELHLDGITGRYRLWYDEMWRKPRGMIGTPNGAPWRPPLIDREQCYEFIVQAASYAQFSVEMSFADREP